MTTDMLAISSYELEDENEEEDGVLRDVDIDGEETRSVSSI